MRKHLTYWMTGLTLALLSPPGAGQGSPMPGQAAALSYSF